MEQVAFAVFEEEHAPATGGGFDWIVEYHAAHFEFLAGGLDGIHAQCEMPPAGEAVILRLWHRTGRSIHLERCRCAGQLDEIRRLRAVCGDAGGTEFGDIPVAERGDVAGGQGDVFEDEVHGQI